MALETDALLGDPAPLPQAEDLVAARVGEQRPRPAHEPVEAAEARDALVAGAQVEVVGVAEDQVGAEGEQVLLAQGLHRGLGAHGHEDRGLDDAVGRVQEAGTRARARAFGDPLEGEGGARRVGTSHRSRSEIVAKR